jgi:formate dehydrogenase assembly factor FdhD
MTKTIHGVVHGKTIELDEDLGVAEGQEVEVQVKVIPKSARKLGEGFLRTEGALADDEEWDAIMEEIYQARKLERRPQIPDLGKP